MKYSVFILFLIFSLAIPFRPVFAVFDRDLTQGSRGEDVRQLQILLNKDPQTVVASSGVGSAGQENGFFGVLTRLAVIKFQEKYRNEILIPNGLSLGTGYVGISTRKILKRLSGEQTLNPEKPLQNNIISSIMVPPPPPLLIDTPSFNIVTTPSAKEVPLNESDPISTVKIPGFSFPETPRRSSSLFILSVSPSRGNPGTLVTIKGLGFSTSTGSTIYIGSQTYSNIASPDGYTLSVMASNPFSTTITQGSYTVITSGSNQFIYPLSIYVRDTTGISNKANFDLQL